MTHFLKGIDRLPSEVAVKHVSKYREEKVVSTEGEMTVTSLKATGTGSSGCGSKAENKTERSEQREKKIVGVWHSVADLPESD